MISYLYMYESTPQIIAQSSYYNLNPYINYHLNINSIFTTLNYCGCKSLLVILQCDNI